jgi:Ankyrin repeat
MNKRIFFSLLITINTITYGMKREVITTVPIEIVFGDILGDIIWCITENICISHNYQPIDICNDIRALSDTNKLFHDYYAKEKVAQNIIRLCSYHLGSNDKEVANELGCRSVAQKIGYFTKVARDKTKKLTESDLKDTWYLNMRTNYQYKIIKIISEMSLLSVAIEHDNIETANLIIDHVEKLNFHYDKDENILRSIIRKYHDIVEYGQYYKYHLLNPLITITERLLEKGIDPNGREGDDAFTPLMMAAYNNTQEIACLLLEYGANPDAIELCNNKLYTAFELETGTPKGWLRTMVNEITTNKQEKK